MSGLTEALKVPPTAVKGPPCSVRTLIAAIDDDEKAALSRALADPDWLATDIARVLRQNGHDLTGTTIARHRRGDCRCSQ